MRLAYTRLVTQDVAALAAVYEGLTGLAPVDMADYVEFRLPGAFLAVCSRRAAVHSHGGGWAAAADSSASLEFQVEDVNIERARLAGLLTDWIHDPRDMPWGNRSMLFRDPDGNPVNVFASAARPA